MLKGHCFILWPGRCGSNLALTESPAAWWPCCLAGRIPICSSAYLTLTSKKYECSDRRSWYKECSPWQLLNSVRLNGSPKERTVTLVRQGVLRARVAQALPPPRRPGTYCLELQYVAGGQTSPTTRGCHLLTSHRLSEIWSCYYLDWYLRKTRSATRSGAGDSDAGTFPSESVPSLCPSMVRGHGVAGGFAFQVWNIIEVVTTHHLSPLMPSHPCWLVAAWLSSGSPGKQHFLAVISSHLPHQWAQPALAGRWEGCLVSLLLLGVKLDESLVGEEWETPVFPLTVKGGMFYIFLICVLISLVSEEKKSCKRNTPELATGGAGETPQLYRF